jgi:signal transduction histidine kinase
MSPKLSEDEQPQVHAVVPFNIDNEFVGVIRLDFSTPREFAAPEQTFFITLMEYCAQALHRAKLTEQIGQLATARERQRLSRDLHDSVKQLLFASSTLAEGIPGLYERAPERAKKYTNDLVNLNRAALAELQSLLFEMRPEAIVTTPFMDLVQNLCTALRGHKSITISLDYDGPEKIYFPVDVHVAFYRLVQETLNNVYKHSDATQVDIQAAYDNRRFNMTIRDNGKGFDLDSHSTGFGMNTMRERAENVGAIFTIHSVVGEGTTITLERQINATPSA